MTTTGETSLSYAFGGWTLDPVRRALAFEGRPVTLQSRAFDALAHLVAHADRLVTKAELNRLLWGDRIVPDASLNQLIFTLRKALSAEEPGQQYVVTAAGRGYRFGSPVSMTGGGAAAPAGQVAFEAGRRRLAHRSVILAGVGGLLALLVVVGGWLYLAHSGRLAPDRTGVVIADFDNDTHDPEFDHFPAKVLDADLRQSPFLNVLTDRQVQTTLGLMKRPPEERLTPQLAAQVCMRNQGGAAIAGSIAAIGSKYLLTLTAVDCVDGRVLVERKAEAAGKEDVPDVLDRLAGEVRRALGESRGSIARFSVPLLAGRTASFDALVSYSQGAWLFGHGRRTEALPLFQHAVDLDPNFASAWGALGIDLTNMREPDKAAPALTRAYALRDQLDEREKLHITIAYQSLVTRDVEAAIRTNQLQTTLYPKDPAAWSNLSNAENQLGRYGAAIAPAKRALELDPGAESNYAVLVRALTHDGQLDAARAVAEWAIAKHVAGEDVRSQLVAIAYAQGDAAEITRQIGVTAGTPAERRLTQERAIQALSDGRVREALSLFDRYNALGAAHGLTDNLIPFRARMLNEMGLTGQARKLLQAVAPTEDTQDLRYDLAAFGDAAKARALLDRDLAARPADTLLVGDYAPSIWAALLLRAGKAREAAAVLRPAWTFAAREFDIPYQQGYTDLAADDPAGAVRDFTYILAHPGHEPDLPELPLARLGLARALEASGNRDGARAAYRAFLVRWKTADPDLPILIAAKREAAALGVKI